MRTHLQHAPQTRCSADAGSAIRVPAQEQRLLVGQHFRGAVRRAAPSLPLRLAGGGVPPQGRTHQGWQLGLDVDQVAARG